MDIIFTIRTTDVPGPTLTWDCPHCGKPSTSAAVFDRSERVALFAILPLFTLRNTFVRCDACKRQSLSTLKAAELVRLPKQQLANYVSPRVSFVTKSVVALSLILFWFPFLGLPLAVAGLWAGRRHKGWIRTTSILATIASAIVTLLVIAIMTIDF